MSFTLSFILYLGNSGDVCNIMSYWTALQEYPTAFSSFGPSDAYIRHWTKPSSVQIIVSHLLGTKTLTKTMLKGHYEQIPVIFQSSYNNFHRRKWIWKCFCKMAVILLIILYTMPRIMILKHYLYHGCFAPLAARYVCTLNSINVRLTLAFHPFNLAENPFQWILRSFEIANLDV